MVEGSRNCQNPFAFEVDDSGIHFFLFFLFYINYLRCTFSVFFAPYRFLGWLTVSALQGLATRSSSIAKPVLMAQVAVRK